MKTLLSCILLLTSVLAANAQKKHISKFVLEKGSTYYINDSLTSILIDTLVMEDSSTLCFPPEKENKLIARLAFIGKSCTLKTTGVTGQDGGDLFLQVHFATLGTLIVDTRGADGASGYDGKDRQYSRQNGTEVKNDFGQVISITPGDITTQDVPGTLGTSGSSGGSGGDEILTYSTTGFTPNFNHANSSQNIIILYKEGRKGKGGRHGRGATLANPNSWRVVTKDSKPGTVKISRVENSSDFIL